MQHLERAVDLRAPHFAQLGNAKVQIFDALTIGFTVPPDISVAQWAEDTREVSAESGSPRPGKWHNAETPYGIEPMECLSINHPATDVTLMCAAQMIKSEIGVNWIGASIDKAPAPFLVVLPSIDEAQKFNRIKFQPTLDATPALKHKVREVKSRDETGSTASNKRFRGGFVQITHAGSSKGLQAITVKHIWGDEISEFPLDAGGRGDPIEQMRQRNSTYMVRGGKCLWTSTPKLKGSCRISQFYDASDQRRWYWPCPECLDYFVFRLANLKNDNVRAPFGSYLAAPCCGCALPHWQKQAMNAGGVWLKTFPSDGEHDRAPGDIVPKVEMDLFRERKTFGRQPGFHLWRGQSTFHDWEMIVRDYLGAKDNPEKLKTFTQQVEAEAYEETGEAPDHLKLYARREEREKGPTLPDGVLAVTGFCDVQQSPARLEWGTYGWGDKMSCWLLDYGVIEGNAFDDAPWHALAEIIARPYEDQWGRVWPIEAFGVDSGYASHAVYNFCRRRPNVYATDGRDGATRPFIGTPKKQDVNWRGKVIKRGVLLWPLGTHPLKSALYASLQKTIVGPDEQTGLWPAACTRFPRNCDEAFFSQITAEYLDASETRDGLVRRMWKKRHGQANEQLDIWVGARAMASHLGLDRYTPAKWAARTAMHAAPDAGGADDLMAHAARIEGATPAGAAPANTTARPGARPAARRVIKSRFME
ncbi:MAG TPA: terminase gpA endonuclease subunit [Rhizomicrobium sp.]|jgi:phage terminase large subunit GpA-like protein